MKRVLVACLLAAACAAPPPPTRPEPTGIGQRALAVFIGLVEGTWESRPETPPIRLRVVEFWKGQSTDRWLYLEWVKPADDSRPVRQRIYRIWEGGGVITAEVFLPPGRDPLQYAGEWRKPAPFASVSPRDLRPLPGCDVRIENRHDFLFAAGTLAPSCRGDRRPPFTERSEFQITSSEANNLEQVFDEKGKPAPEVPPYELLKTSRQAR